MEPMTTPQEPTEVSLGDRDTAVAQQSVPETETTHADPQNIVSDETRAVIEQLEGKLQELQQRHMRMQADFDNFRRRSRLEKEEYTKYAHAQLLEGVLPIVDNFERALAVRQEQQDVEAVIRGVTMIYRQMEQWLEQAGVQPIMAVGKSFDPAYHQALAQTEASAAYPSGTIVEQLQRGYVLHEKVIRPAMVKVAE
jgi:molecular chaperone GrpE